MFERIECRPGDIGERRVLRGVAEITEIGAETDPALRTARDDLGQALRRRVRVAVENDDPELPFIAPPPRGPDRE